MKINPATWVNIFLITIVFGGSPDDWKQRTIYQLLTDRFAQTTDTTNGCDNLSDYCGGTFDGITNHLDYITGMGFDSIWISPVVTNTDEGYHGYWAQDIYTINSNFGSETDLINLGNSLHKQNMYLMIDVVANHMGTPPNYDYTQLTPFNESYYFHSCNDCPSSCDIEDWSDQNEVEICRLAGLPDLNQSNSFVNKTLLNWVKNYVVSTWQADGIRIDTVPEVNGDFWTLFQEFAGVYAVGEVDNGDPTYDGPYQNYIDGILSYPMFYTIRDAFGSGNGMEEIDSRINDDNSNFKDINLLGTFVDNHDNDRFLCDYPGKIRQYMNALTFVLTFPGIPIIYYGTEQEYSGCSDPDNREVLWTSGYDMNSTLYTFISTVVKTRKMYKIWDNDFNVVSSQDTFYSYNRGSDFLVCLTNVGDNTGTDQYDIDNPGLTNGETYCNIFWPSTDCFTYNGGTLTIYLLNGESKVYINQNSFSTDIWKNTFNIDFNYFNHNTKYWGKDPMYTTEQTLINSLNYVRTSHFS